MGPPHSAAVPDAAPPVILRRGGRRDAAVLAAGSAANGLLAYAVFAVSTRALGADSAASVSVLWTYWAFAGAAFTFPIQHWVTHTATAHGMAAVRSGLPRVLGLLAVCSLAAAIIAWVLREPLFHRTDPAFPVMVGLVTAGSAAVGLARGGLSARRRFTAVALSLVLENLLRLAGVTALAAAGHQGSAGYGLCLVAGLAVALFWPTVLSGGVAEPDANPPGPFRFLAGAGGAQLTSQVLLTGGPVLVSLSGGRPADVTALFAGLALFRAPYLLGLGMVAKVTTAVTRLASRNQLDQLRRATWRLAALTALATSVATLVGGWLGPDLLRLVFGPEVVLDPLPAALLAAGCTLALGSLFLTVMSLAQDRSTEAVSAWLAAAALAALAFVLLGGLTAVPRIAWCFVGAELSAFVILLTLGVRAVRS